MTFILLAAAAVAGPIGAAPSRLTVEPMAAPRPALRYQLLPEVRELTPGNAAHWYMRCFMEQRYFFFSKEGVAQRTRLRGLSLKELAKEAPAGYGGSALSQADWGARLDAIDWQVLDRVQTDGPDVRLPELGPMHALAVSLQIRLRGEVGRGDFDAAVGTAKTMFALARHLGDYPASAAAALGQQTAALALDALWEMVGQPGAPNLYWALTNLPAPLVELRRGVQGDRVLVDTELKGFRDDVALSDAQLDDLVGRLSGRAGLAREQVGLPPRNLRSALQNRAKDSAAVAAARARLIEAGAPKHLVGGFSPTQVLLLDDRREYDARRDDRLKLLGLKAWELDSVAEAATGPDGLFTDLLPPVLELRREQARFEQRVALLRCVEALRAYAAANGGKLPESLSAAGVPVPDDPLTGKPFGYARDGATAALRAAGPKGSEGFTVTVTLAAPAGNTAGATKPAAPDRPAVKK